MAIAHDEPDIILLTEIIPKAQKNPIPPAALTVPGYKSYMNFDASDHNLGECGQRGISIFLKESIKATQVVFHVPSEIEHLFVQIHLTGPDQLLVGCIYRSPSAHGLSSTLKLVELLKICSLGKKSHVLVAGDVNFPQIDWVSGFSHAPDGHHTHLFTDCLNECGLTQHVTTETRFRDGVRPSSLDIILSNEEGLVKNIVYHPPIGNSDHVVIRFSAVCHDPITELNAPRLNYHKGDYALLNKRIAESVWEAPDPVNPRLRYESFKSTLARLSSCCIPKSCPLKETSHL